MLSAVIALSVLALLASFGLAIAARVFAVETDPRIELVEEALPGANCGGCGYPGCAGLAKAIVEGKAKVEDCPVGGEETRKAISEIMGISFEGGQVRMVALVNCKGDDQVASKRFFYNGIHDCASAALIFGGDKSCSYGCLGLGTCAEACPFGAIMMLESGLAEVEPDKCTGCGQCVDACPKGIIKMVPAERRLHILCSSHDKGAAARKACKTACIACQKCVKSAPEGSIVMDDFLAVVNYDFDIPYEVAEECPMNTIVVRDPGDDARSGCEEKTAAGGGA
ncbi:MAG: RnfABCDGE type electron transport complex subunit B [Candidatus Krumholzibacteriota bacterium]|nr:RnfABCDGE type electron transport complex subunit B [Candidatus Krumholzibacteriota bacterium]